MLDNIRFDLIPEQGLLEVHKVLNTKLKDHGKDSWKTGISWSDLLSNLEKHLSAFKVGKDFDENGALHMAHVASQALLLCSAYKDFPHCDDRAIATKAKPIIALDIDDVCLDFLGTYEKQFGKLNSYWNGSYDMLTHLEELKDNKEFWTNLPALHLPTFEPDMYITSRSIDPEWTKENLRKMGFPCAPVYSIPWNQSKVALLKEHHVDILIDDKVQNYKDATAAGIFCYLMDCEHNHWFKVPEHRRIYNLNLEF